MQPSTFPTFKTPDTRDWQLADYVRFLNPYAERLKKSHDRWRKTPDSETRHKIEQQNRLLLSFCQDVLATAPKVRAEAEVISDLHLGFRYCSDLEALAYLNSIQPEYLFLNGDMIDHLVMKNRHDLNPIQRAIIRRIRDMKQEGCNVIRLRGNHDVMDSRQNGETGYAGIPVYKDVMFISSDGKRNLLTHGDRFDKITGSKGKLEKIGGMAYDMLVLFNHYHKKLSRMLGIRHWSFARFCKVTSKKICMALSHFDDLVFAAADQVKADVVLGGHTHIYMHEKRGDREYLNSADWVETCAALRKMPGQAWQLIMPMERHDSPSFVHPRHERPPAAKPRRVIMPAQAQGINPVLLGRGEMEMVR
jgi:UDP-2,3-diacylglucosamine pyrophosphatase LpxH